MDIKLYNSLSRQIEDFKPLKKGAVGLYTCGPTVYNYAHIGNLRTYVFEDILKRALEYNGYKVKHIMNITDVGHLTDDADTGEDKMEKGSAREGKTAWEVAKFYEQAFMNDLAELNIQPANKYPRATGHIKEQIHLIKTLEEKGFIYKTGDGIYFDTSKLPNYGVLANLKNQHLQAGSRVAVGDKKNPTDFALWKFSTAGGKRQMEWPSPWGVGFPGWHIECSAMAAKYLGVPFDIHCGGIDHIPVHHTNEIAQTEGATGKMLANYWLHGEFLLMGSDKMAKSGDNFVTLATLKEKGISPLAYRYLLLQTHYRKQLTFSWEALKAAENGLRNFLSEASVLYDHKENKYSKEKQKNIEEKFKQKINDDLDLPGAFALIRESMNNAELSVEYLFKFDEVLGLNIKTILKLIDKKVPAPIRKLLDEREAARANKDWAKSDELRKELETLGYTVKDTADGTKITKN